MLIDRTHRPWIVATLLLGVGAVGLYSFIDSRTPGEGLRGGGCGRPLVWRSRYDPNSFCGAAFRSEEGARLVVSWVKAGVASGSCLVWASKWGPHPVP